MALGGALDLDEAARVVHYDVHVCLGFRVLLIVEVEDRHALEDADGDRGDLAVNRIARDLARGRELVGREREREIAAGDRGRARAAVRLQHVAVDGDRVLA